MKVIQNYISPVISLAVCRGEGITSRIRSASVSAVQCVVQAEAADSPPNTYNVAKRGIRIHTLLPVFEGMVFR